MPRRPGNSSGNCAGRGTLSLAVGLFLAVATGAGVSAALIPLGPPCWCAAGAWAQSNGGNTPPPPPVSAKKSARPAAEQDKKSADEEKDRVLIDADDLRYDGQRKLYVLRRNVHIRHKDAELFCDWAEYHEDTDTAVARGHLVLKDPENRITGDVINLDFTDEVAVVEGNVVIVAQKKKKSKTKEKPEQGDKTGTSGAKNSGEKKTGASGDQSVKTGPASANSQATDGAASEAEEKEPSSIEELRERKTTIYCTKLRYHYTDGERYAWLTGPIRAEQKDRTAWADRAEYDGEEGTVKLMGHVRVKTKQGDEFECPVAVVSIEDEWLKAEKVSGVAVRRKKKDNKQQGEGTGQPGEQKPSAANKKAGVGGGESQASE